MSEITQLELFPDLTDDRTINVKFSLIVGWRPFGIDNLQKAATMYGIMTENVWRIYMSYVEKKEKHFTNDNL